MVDIVALAYEVKPYRKVSLREFKRITNSPTYVKNSCNAEGLKSKILVDELSFFWSH